MQMDTNSFLTASISGKHMICDLQEVRNIELMNSVDGIQSLLDSICDKYQFQILARSSHAFSPIGATVLFLLSESHISVHTFPERSYVAVDIYTCRDMKDDSDYRDIYSMFVSAFGASEHKVPLIIDRRFS